MSPEVDGMPEGWDYGPELRPARSLLVGIDPIGLGTPWAESLAGYIARLAWRHGLAPARLVRDVSRLRWVTPTRWTRTPRPGKRS